MYLAAEAKVAKGDSLSKQSVLPSSDVPILQWPPGELGKVHWLLYTLQNHTGLESLCIQMSNHNEHLFQLTCICSKVSISLAVCSTHWLIVSSFTITVSQGTLTLFDQLSPKSSLSC